MQASSVRRSPAKSLAPFSKAPAISCTEPVFDRKRTVSRTRSNPKNSFPGTRLGDAVCNHDNDITGLNWAFFFVRRAAELNAQRHALGFYNLKSCRPALLCRRFGSGTAALDFAGRRDRRSKCTRTQMRLHNRLRVSIGFVRAGLMRVRRLLGSAPSPRKALNCNFTSAVRAAACKSPCQSRRQ